MPGLIGLLEAAIYVDDVERSVEFYRRVLGFEILDADDRLTALSVAAHQVLLICRRGASASMPMTAHDATGSQHLAFAIPGSELGGWETRLHQHGVTIEQQRTWGRGGRSLYFRDPDGHLLELATPGVWAVY